MWKIIVMSGQSQMTIWRMHFACGINKVIDTHSEYISLIAISLQIVTRRHINLTYYANYRSDFLIRLSCHTAADNHATTLLPPSLSPFIPSLYSIIHVGYLLTPRSRVLLEKLTGFQLVKKFSAFYGTRRFITEFTSASQLSLS
jgi:hypothetical protein